MDTDMNLRMNIKDSYEHENDYGYEDAYAQIEFIEILILICICIYHIYVCILSLNECEKIRMSMKREAQHIALPRSSQLSVALLQDPTEQLKNVSEACLKEAFSRPNNKQGKKVLWERFNAFKSHLKAVMKELNNADKEQLWDVQAANHALQAERPKDTGVRQLFLTHRIPFCMPWRNHQRETKNKMTEKARTTKKKRRKEGEQSGQQQQKLAHRKDPDHSSMSKHSLSTPPHSSRCILRKEDRNTEQRTADVEKRKKK